MKGSRSEPLTQFSYQNLSRPCQADSKFFCHYRLQSLPFCSCLRSSVVSQVLQWRAMMSVLTKLLLLTICLSLLASGAPNQKNDENFQILSHLRLQDVSANTTDDAHYPKLATSGSSRAPLKNSTGPGRSYMSSGTAKSGSSGIIPYPTEGAPYQNSTLLYTTLGSGKGENGLNGSRTQCPPQQTVTLSPQTITLPAQTITVTLAPETITINPQTRTETVTVTVTPQTQTTTVTVWMTVTAGQSPSCPSPSNAANSQIFPVPAPNVQPSITPIAPAFDNNSSPAIVPSVVTSPNLVVPISTVVAVPTANATSSVIPNLAETAATFPANDQTSTLAQQTSSSVVSSMFTGTPIIAPYRYRNTTNQTLPIGSGSSRGLRPGSAFAAATNGHFSSYFVSKFVTVTPTSTTIIGPSATSGFFPGNGSSFLTPPSRANATVFKPTAGPTAPPSPTAEYFPDNGSSLLTPPAQANATISPTMKYFPDDGSSLLMPPVQANVTSIPPIGGSTAPIITPAVVASSQTLAVVVGSVSLAPPPPPPPSPILQSNTSTSIPPMFTPIPPPSPPTTIQSNTSTPIPPPTTSSQNPQPPTTSPPPFCTNGTTTQNITTNVRPPLISRKHLPPPPTNTSTPVLRDPTHTLHAPDPSRPKLHNLHPLHHHHHQHHIPPPAPHPPPRPLGHGTETNLPRARLPLLLPHIPGPVLRRRAVRGDAELHGADGRYRSAVRELRCEHGDREDGLGGGARVAGCCDGGGVGGVEGGWFQRGDGGSGDGGGDW